MNEIIINGSKMDDKLIELKQVQTDGKNWFIYYIDEKSGEKWIKEYPHSSYHGGGEPQLRLLSKFPWE